MVYQRKDAAKKSQDSKKENVSNNVPSVSQPMPLPVHLQATAPKTDPHSDMMKQLQKAN